MVSCCILKCTKRTTRDKGIGFFRIPNVITIRCNKTLELSKQRRHLWLERIGRGNFFNPGDHTRVCSLHFVSGQAADLFDPANVDWAPSLNLGHDQPSFQSESSLQDHTTIVETQCSSMSHHGMFEYIAVPAAKQRVEAINIPECVDEDLLLAEDYDELHEEIHIKDEPLSEEDEDEINLQAYMLSERLLAQQQVDSRTSTPSPNALVMNVPEAVGASSSNHHVNPPWDAATPDHIPFTISIPEEDGTSTHADGHWETPNHLVIGVPDGVNSSTRLESPVERVTTCPNRLVVRVPENINSSCHHKSPVETVSPNHLVLSIPVGGSSSTQPESPVETMTASSNRLSVRIPENINSSSHCKSPVETASQNHFSIPKGGKSSTCPKSRVEIVAAAPNRLIINIPDEANDPRHPKIPADISMSPEPLVINIPEEPSSPQVVEKSVDTSRLSPDRLVINIPDEAEKPNDTVTVSVSDKVTVICTTPVPPVSPPRPPEGPPVNLTAPVEKKSKTWQVTVGTKSGQTKRCMVTTTADTTMTSLSDDKIAQLATAVMDDKIPAVCKVALDLDGTFRFLNDDSPSKEPVVRPISIVKNAQSKPVISVKRLVKKPVFDPTNKLLSTKPNTIVTLNPNRPSIMKTREVGKISDEVTITSVKQIPLHDKLVDRRRKQDMAPRISVRPVPPVQKIATKQLGKNTQMSQSTKHCPPKNTAPKPQTEDQIKIVSYSGSRHPANKSSTSAKEIQIASYSGSHDIPDPSSRNPLVSHRTNMQQKIQRMMRASPFYCQLSDFSTPYICHVCEEKTKGETATINHIFQHCFVDRDNKTYVCTQCDFECNTKMELKVHSTVHDIFKFQCQQCRIYLLSAAQLKKHVDISHKKTEQVAAEADKDLEDKEREELMKQVTENHDTPGNITRKNRPYFVFTNFVCNLCLQKFESKRELLQHAEATHNDKFKEIAWRDNGKRGHLHCHLCEYNTAFSDNYYSHVLRHRGVSAYYCRHCSRSFDSRQGFYKHCQNQHPHEVEFQKMWDERNETKQTQNNEPLTHVDFLDPTEEERNSKNMVIIVCSLCSKRFDNLPKLHQHCQTVHSANKLKGFDDDAVNTNYRTFWKNRMARFGIKGFMCKYCGKLFSYRHGVLLHQNLIHKKLVDEDLFDVPKYTCDICQKTALGKSWLQSHIQKKHLNPTNQQFSAFRLKKDKPRIKATSSRRSSVTQAKPTTSVDSEKNAEPGLQSITQSTETAEKNAEPGLENIVQSSVQSNVEPNEVDLKSKSEQEEFDWAYWTSLGLRKSSRKRKKREFSDYIDYEEVDVSKRDEIFDIVKGRRKWVYVKQPDNESSESPPSPDNPEKSPQLEEKLEEKAPQEETATLAPLTDDPKPAVFKRKFVKYPLARKMRRKRSLVMKKKHYKKKIVIDALSEAKEVTSLASENTPVTLASEDTPQDMASEITPPNCGLKNTPANLDSENTPATLVTEVTSPNLTSTISPSKSLESVENLPISKIPFKKRLSKMGSSENLQVETENEGTTETVEVQNQTAADEKSPATDTVGDTSALVSADNPVINSEQPANSVSDSKDSVRDSVPQVESNLAESEIDSCGQESKANVENALPNVNTNVPTKRKLNLKKTGRGKKKLKVQTSNLQTENVDSVPDVGLRESVIKRTPEKILTEAPSLKENNESTSVPDSTEKLMPVLDPEVASQSASTLLESPVTCSPGVNDSSITPGSMRKSVRERKKKDFGDFVPTTNRRFRLNALEASVAILGQEKVESTPLVDEGKSKSPQLINPVPEIPAVNLKRSRKPSLKLKDTKEPDTPEVVPKPGNKRPRKSNINAEIQTPELTANIDSPVQKKGRKSKVNTEIETPELTSNIDKQGQKKGRKSKVNTEVKPPELTPNIDSPVQRKGRKSKVNTEVKPPELTPNIDSLVQRKGRKSNAEVKTQELVHNNETQVPKRGRKSNVKVGEGKVNEGKMSENPPAAACEKKAETTELAGVSLSVATAVTVTDELSATSETPSSDMNSPNETETQDTVQVDKEESKLVSMPSENKDDPTVNASESSNCSAVDEADSINGPTVNEAESSNGLTVNEAESSNGLTVNEAESSNGLTVNEAESSNGLIVNVAESSNGLTVNEAESSNGLTVNAAESPNGLSMNETKKSSGSTENETERPNGSTENETESPNGSTENETESPNGLAVNKAERINGPTEISSESLNGPTVNETESPNSLTGNTTESPNGLSAAESPGSVPSVGEAVTNLDSKKPQTAVTPKRARVSKLANLSDSVRKSSRPRKMREISDF